MSGPAASTGVIRLLCAGALHRVIDEAAPAFARESGTTVTVQFASSSGVKTRGLGGEPADVVITTRAALDELAASGRIVGDSIRTIALSPIGVAVRAGAARPDIRTVAAFRDALLRAQSIAYADPATGSPSANHFVKVLERLGVAEALKAKTRLIRAVPGTVVVVCEAVKAGEAEIGVQQISEIVGVEGVELVGSLPDDLQLLTPFCGAIAAQAADAQAARALMAYLTSSAVAPAIEACGMRPG
jgi:molybdate transport system substrate-binding protein